MHAFQIPTVREYPQPTSTVAAGLSAKDVAELKAQMGLRVHGGLRK